MIPQLADQLNSMKGKIPELCEIEVGTDFNRSERAWDVVLVTGFATKEDLQGYATDLYHQEVIKWIKANEIVTSVVDYERG